MSSSIILLYTLFDQKITRILQKRRQTRFQIRTKYERLKLTSVLVKEPWAIAFLTVNPRLLRNKDKQPTLLIVPRRFIRNHKKGGSYKVVSVQGDWIFADCTSHTDKSLIKTQLRFTTDEARAIILSNLASNRRTRIL
jgi:hypothetical protein